jgi:hypothetical protein
MTGTIRIGFVAAVLGFAACDTGSVGNGGPDANTSPDQALGIICNATFKLTGTFVQSEAQPSGTSCWPVGMWTFTASMDSNQCNPAPAILPQYQVQVGEVPDVDGFYDWTYSFVTNTNAKVLLKVSGDGGGICQGGFEVFSDDGKQVWDMKPSLETGNVLDGFGEYALYDSNQWM